MIGDINPFETIAFDPTLGECYPREILLEDELIQAEPTTTPTMELDFSSSAELTNPLPEEEPGQKGEGMDYGFIELTDPDVFSKGSF